MKWIRRIRDRIFFDTFGALASASFLICAISGIVIAVPYDVTNPYDSISLLLISNPSASVFRNLHYWAAQFFLIFTIFHLYDHLKAGTEKNQTHGIWLRLTISIFVVFFVMISGFILKADADSLQARRIIASLIETIPLGGKLLSSGILGFEEDFQIIYVHHIATATIFLIFIIWEHARTLWTQLSTFLILLIILTLLSIMLSAPLHDNQHSVVKGPWYMVGLQEILHWLSYPGWVMFFVLIIFGSIYLLFHISEISNQIIKKILLIILFIYLMLTVIGYFFRGENWTWQVPWQKSIISSVNLKPGWDFASFNFSEYEGKEIPFIHDRREACLLCHKGVSGLSSSHNPQAIGCTSCHYGDPFSLNKDRAHRNMILIPGNLANAKQTCGTIGCHPEIVQRVSISLMATNSGIVSVDRFVFGETGSPDIKSHIQEIGLTPADQHLRNLCSNCHLGNEKIKTGSIDELSRGGGCNACHLNYSKSGLEQHFAYQASDKSATLLPKIHPSLDLHIGNGHCFGCHSRSGRISANYEGWHETMLDEKDVNDAVKFRVLQDKRVFEFVSSDIHHQRGLECIDCHGSYELMGDGKHYFHEEEAIKIKCEDCHTNSLPRYIAYEKLDLETKKIFDLRKFDTIYRNNVVVSASDLEIVNVILMNGEVKMISKNSKKIHPLKPPASVCTKDIVHGSLTCSSCHTAWAPHCIGCHNEFDKKEGGYDLLKNKPVKGTWVEYAGNFLAEPPTLGVRTGLNRQIEPCVPGMILSIDKSGFINSGNDQTTISHRLYAPVSPHTTNNKGRNCKSCHNNPIAIGYGRGELKYEIQDGKGRWSFQAEYASSDKDGLPLDAWTGFLTQSKGIVSTRINFRPFTPEEQKKILNIGSCLTCHDEGSKAILKSLDIEFSEYKKQLSPSCILSEW